ncbi:5-methylcytosine rRNA methyltransferase NSUN4 [Aphelenchoides bicaudatus]|nr:5-methylcytosine rRNA methyltransferase NSUN4 [Aphelenchoides bicaudatus]
MSVEQKMEVDSAKKDPLKETVLLAQHDWNHVTSNPDESFFVGYRRPAEKSNFFDVKLDKQRNEYQNEVLKCKKLPNRALSVEFFELGLQKTFVAPFAEYDHLHTAAVSTLDISSTGNLVVSADSSTGLLVWDAQSGNVLRELKGHILDVNCARFFPSGMVILSGGIDMGVPNLVSRNRRMSSPILDLSFIGRGEEVCSSAKDGTLKKWNCGNGECTMTLNLPSGSANCFAFNVEKSLVVAGTDQGYFYIYDLQSESIVKDLFLNTVLTSVATHGDYAFVGGENGAIFVVDLKKNEISQTLKMDRGRVQKVAIAQDSLIEFASTTIPTASPQSKIEFTGADCDPVYDFTKSSKYLFTGCRDKIIRKYSIEALLKMEQVNVLAFLRRFRAPSVLSVRTKTQRFKPKIAAVRPDKTPSMFALDHFDFYYGPLYGPKHWPSIRLGLLSPNKFVAVLNRLSADYQANEAIIRDLSTVEIIERLTMGKNAPKNDKNPLEGINQEAQEGNDEQTDSQFNNRTDLASRSEEGMGEFRQSEGEFTYGQVQMGDTSLEKRRTMEQQIEITGFEHVGQRLDKIDDQIVYPRNLKLFTFDRDDISDFPSPMKDRNGISSWWLLDGGSIVPVLALNLQDGDSILDLCAAPGGKSLLMAQIGNFERLICNDGKMSRLGQLRRGPFNVYSNLNERIVLKRKDASNLDTWDEENLYDKVLVDAPCNTDRLAVSQDEGNLFSIGMTQERLDLPQVQTKLLLNALRSVKVGGSVVYSTCTLSPTQNESVIENTAALARRHFGINVVEQSLSRLENHLKNTFLFRFADKCQRGLLVVPNIRSNYGPMYVCKLLRTR